MTSLNSTKRIHFAGMLSGTVIAAACALAVPRAAAQMAEAESPTLAEVVVTAQKRESTVEKTPISMTAVTGSDLQERGITDFSSIAAQIPSVSMKTNGPGQTEFEMRGMTSGGGNSPTVGFYLDDVPMTAPAAAQNGKVVIDPTLYDLNRIEVLRGPQGTLYGSGSMGGTIKLITNQPNVSTLQAGAQAILSDTDGGGLNHDENGMLNLPLISGKLALRLVASAQNTSGWIDRVVAGSFPNPTDGGATRGDVLSAPVLGDYRGSNSQTLRGARAALQWLPIDGLSIIPEIFYQRITQAGPSAFDSDPGTLAHYQPFDIAEPYSDGITVESLTVNDDLGPVDVTSVTAYWHRVSRMIQDGSENFENSLDGFPNSGTFYGPDGTGPIDGDEIDPSRQFSEELRAASNTHGRLNWVVGLFYSDFDSDWDFSTSWTNPAAFFATIDTVWALQQHTQIRQKAAFGEATYSITGKLKLTLGGRWYSYTNHFSETYDGFGEPQGDDVPMVSTVLQDNSGGNPKVNVSYQIARDTLLYATAARGFRPGGGNVALPTNASPVGACIQAGLQALGYNGASPLSYGPDSVWSYEAGEKSTFLGRFRVNGSVYTERWKNVQLEELPCNYPIYDDGRLARVYGGELEFQALLDDDFYAAVSTGYSNAYVAESSHGYVAGNMLPDVPRVTASVSLYYHRRLTDSLELLARAENIYTGNRVDLTFPGGVPNTQTPLGGYDLTNLRVGIQSLRGWTAYVFADNALDKRASLENIAQLTLANASFNRVETKQPLTIGVDLSYQY
jgi:iron complex outermembrane recepter protein